MAKRSSMLALIMAMEAAEHIAWAQRCPAPRVYHIIINYGNYLIGEYVCEDEERVCHELLWALNDALEKLGYTVLWKIWPSYKRLEFRAYRKPEEMLPIRAE